MLSRLKGIETILTACSLDSSGLTLDMLSRLKGIETLHSRIPLSDRRPRFGYAFPFEGN